MWTVPAILAIIGGVALLAGLFGGFEAQQVTIPPLEQRARYLSFLTGLAFIVLAIWLSQQPATPVIDPQTSIAPAPALPSATPSAPSDSVPPTATVAPPAVAAGDTPTAASSLAPSGSTAFDTVLLHSTLDNRDAIAAPAVGQGGTLFNVEAGDFVPAQSGSGIDFTREEMMVTFPAVRGGVQHVDLARGEVEFWYKPHYDAKEPPPGRKVLFRVGVTADNPPALSLAMDGGALQWSATDGEWNRALTQAPYAAPLWSAEEWVHVRAVWDGTSDDSLQLYLNGNRVDDGGVGPWNLGDEADRLRLYIGQGDGHYLSDGVIDEFIIRSPGP